MVQNAVFCWIYDEDYESVLTISIRYAGSE
jgi:hypothetical protein